MMYWIYEHPSWEIWLLFTGAFVTVTWAGILLVRATVVHSWIHRDRRSNDVVEAALSNFFVLFGLLLGLLAVATYQNFTVLSDLVDREASAIAALDRDFDGYPKPVRTQLRDGLREYARITIEEDWAQQREGIVPIGGTERITMLAHSLFGFEPSRKSEEIAHAEALRQFNHIFEIRRQRLANVTLGMPPVLWWVVAIGALMNIALIWLQDMEIHVHLILAGILASILGTVVFLIAALDNPFRGEVAVGPDSIALIYEAMKAPGPDASPVTAHGQTLPAPEVRTGGAEAAVSVDQLKVVRSP